MSKSDTLENGVLSHILNNADITLIGDAGGLRGSVTAGSLYLSLHISDPADTDVQTTGEISYTGYGRIAVLRDGTAWTVTGGVASLVADKLFAASTGGTGGTVGWIGIGTASSGAGKMLYTGTISPTIAVTSGVQPKILAGTTITET